MIILKTDKEIGYMREAGQILASTLAALKAAVEPGISTLDLDKLAEKAIRQAGAKPSFKGYKGFPATLCTSINEEVVHGIPSARRRVKDGDLLSIDIGCIVNGYHADSAVTIPVGAVSENLRRLLDATEQAMWAGIRQARAGNRLGDIGAAIQAVGDAAGYGIVRDFVGHGIGQALHEDPQVPNYGTPGYGSVLKAGMCLAIEPMFNLGTHVVKVLDDKWTVVTADNSLSAHFEHSLVVRDGEPEVLTVLRQEALSK